MQGQAPPGWCSAEELISPLPFQARARQGWLVAGTVGCPGPEIALSSKIPVTRCLDFLWDRPTLLVLGR